MENKIIAFQDNKIKREWFDNEWWFCVSDVVGALTESADVKQYIKKKRSQISVLTQLLLSSKIFPTPFLQPFGLHL